MHAILEEIGRIGIVPVVKLDDAKDAVPLAKALCAGGLPVAEITFRTPAAEASIRAIAQHVPGMLLGAGTVLTPEQADRAVAAGAKFIVSPGLNPRVVRHCVEKGIPITPGCACASDIERAIELGLEVVKFFPSEPAGGLKMIKALAAPYVGMRFMPTGGIGEGNLCDYLAYPRVLACGGSWMVKDELIKAGDFAGIEALTRGAVRRMLGFAISHVGINAGAPEKAGQLAGRLSTLLGLPAAEAPAAFFAGDLVEVMKAGGRGTHGHIAIATNSLGRAVRYLESLGFGFDATSAKVDAEGRPTIIYLQEEIGGFAIHLQQR